MDFDGQAQGAAVPLADPAPSGALSLGWAGGWLLVADEGGPMRALADDADALEADDFLPAAYAEAAQLSGDGDAFGFRTWSEDSGDYDVWRVTPESFSGAACAASSYSDRMAFGGDTVAWLWNPVGEWFLNYAMPDAECGEQGSFSIGNTGATYEPLGVAGGMALTVVASTTGSPRRIDLALYELATQSELAERLVGQAISAPPFAVVMGGLDYALLLTLGDPAQPLLIRL
jgi:hypothetical protein